MNKIKVLLVEDSKELQCVLFNLLKENGFDYISCADNGKEAIELSEIDDFDLIIMDMQMPVINGFEASEKIRKMLGYGKIPIFALHFYDSEIDIKMCVEAGATKVFKKPLNQKDLIFKVKECFPKDAPKKIGKRRYTNKKPFA